MATHFNIFAWKIPWTEKPGRLHYMRESDMTKHEDTQYVPGIPLGAFANIISVASLLAWTYLCSFHRFKQIQNQDNLGWKQVGERRKEVGQRKKSTIWIRIGKEL